MISLAVIVTDDLALWRLEMSLREYFVEFFLHGFEHLAVKGS